MQNILTQSFAAGTLAAIGILLPILLYKLPATPMITKDNVRTMMTILVTIAGFVVFFAMCLPFNRYRALSLAAICGVTSFLGLIFPASYLGGQTIGPKMMEYDRAAGQTIFDSEFVRQMFRPQNSTVIKNLLGDKNNFVVLRLFLYVAIPIYILLQFAIENYNRKNYGKDVKKNRSFRIGRRMLLSSGFVLILHALLSISEAVSTSFGDQLVLISDKYRIGTGLSIFINILFTLFYLVIGYIGYKVWKDPTKKMLRVAFGSAIALLLLTIANMLLSNSVIAKTNDILLIIDNTLILIAAVGYIVGACIVRAQYHLGLLKPRES